MNTVDDQLQMLKTFFSSGISIHQLAQKIAEEIEMTSELKRVFSQGEYAIGTSRKNDILVINFVTTALAICICRISVDMSEEAARDNLNSAMRSVLAHLELYTEFVRTEGQDVDAEKYFEMMAGNDPNNYIELETDEE